MGWFKIVEKDSSFFPKDSSGRKIYYPWSIFGKGYYVDTAEQEQQILASWKKWFLLNFLGCMVFYFFMMTFFKTSLTLAMLLILLTYSGLLFFRVKKVTVGLTPCPTRQTITQSIDYITGRFTFLQLIMMELGGFWFFANIWLIPLRHKIDLITFPIIFGLEIIYFGWALVIKIKKRKQPSI